MEIFPNVIWGKMKSGRKKEGNVRVKGRKGKEKGSKGTRKQKKGGNKK